MRLKTRTQSDELRNKQKVDNWKCHKNSRGILGKNTISKICPS